MKQICLEETAIVKIRGVSLEGVIDELTASVYCRMQHHRNSVIGLLLTNSVLQPLKQCSSDIEVASLEVTPMNPTRKPAVNYNKQRPSCQGSSCRTDWTDFPNCLLILVSISVFTVYFLLFFHFLVFGSVW